MVDDMCIQEMYALKCASYYNRAIKMSWLEDGGNAYFDIGVKSGGMGSTPLKRFIRKLFFSIKFNLGNFYDLGSCMGTHRLLKNIYVLFPEAVRREHMDQGKILITEEEFSKGMEFIYKDKPIALLGNGVLIAMDKIDVYGDMKSNVNDFIKEIVQNETRLGNTVLYKYHPRETDSLQALHSCQELDRTVALESYLVNSEARNLTIIGFKSTALQTAKKMGYETISYIKQLEPNNNAVIDFYKSIGIICK